DDDRSDADLLDQHDVAGEVPGDLVIDHGVAAIFDDEGLAGIALHIGQRLLQRARGAQPMLGFGEITDLSHGRALYRKGVGVESKGGASSASSGKAARRSSIPWPAWALVAMISGWAAPCRASSAATLRVSAASASAPTLSTLVSTS